LRTNFLKKKKEQERILQKQQDKSSMVKPNAERLMTMQYFGDMDESKLIDIVGNQISPMEYFKLEGTDTIEKVKNIKKYWEAKKHE
jgi:hypothetical protein